MSLEIKKTNYIFIENLIKFRFSEDTRIFFKYPTSFDGTDTLPRPSEISEKNWSI